MLIIFFLTGHFKAICLTSELKIQTISLRLNTFYKKQFIEQAFNVSVTNTDIFDQGESIKELRDDIVAQLIGENNELLFIRICNAYNNGGVFDMVGLRIDLFKRLNIYAFGIMLLELITVSSFKFCPVINNNVQYFFAKSKGINTLSG